MKSFLFERVGFGLHVLPSPVGPGNRDTGRGLDGECHVQRKPRQTAQPTPLPFVSGTLYVWFWLVAVTHLKE